MNLQRPLEYKCAQLFDSVRVCLDAPELEHKLLLFRDDCLYTTTKVSRLSESGREKYIPLERFMVQG